MKNRILIVAMTFGVCGAMLAEPTRVSKPLIIDDGPENSISVEYHKNNVTAITEFYPYETLTLTLTPQDAILAEGISIKDLRSGYVIPGATKLPDVYRSFKNKLWLLYCCIKQC